MEGLGKVRPRRAHSISGLSERRPGPSPPVALPTPQPHSLLCRRWPRAGRLPRQATGGRAIRVQVQGAGEVGVPPSSPRAAWPSCWLDRLAWAEGWVEEGSRQSHVQLGGLAVERGG